MNMDEPAPKKKRSVLFTGLISFLVPGIGHIYAGRASRLPYILAIYYGVPLLFANLLPVARNIHFYYSYMLVIIACVVMVVGDAAYGAYKSNPIQLKKYNKWYVYLFFCIGMFSVSLLQYSQRSFLYGYGTYHIPSTSMQPTLIVGDFIVTDVRAYRNNPLSIGDVVVLFPPGNSNVEYVKRIIGLPGDTVSIKDGNTYVNGKQISNFSIPTDEEAHPYSREFDPITVPDGSIFVLGDNRDNSVDSRYFGVVPEQNIRGRVTYIWYSMNQSRTGMKVQ